MKRLLALLFLLFASCETTLPEGDNYVPDFKDQTIQGAVEYTPFEKVDSRYKKNLSVLTFYFFDKTFTPADTTYDYPDSAALDTLRQVVVQVPREIGLHRMTTWGNRAVASGHGIEDSVIIDSGAVEISALSLNGDTVSISVDIFADDSTYINGTFAYPIK